MRWSDQLFGGVTANESAASLSPNQRPVSRTHARRKLMKPGVCCLQLAAKGRETCRDSNAAPVAGYSCGAFCIPLVAGMNCKRFVKTTHVRREKHLATSDRYTSPVRLRQICRKRKGWRDEPRYWNLNWHSPAPSRKLRHQPCRSALTIGVRAAWIAGKKPATIPTPSETEAPSAAS